MSIEKSIVMLYGLPDYSISQVKKHLRKDQAVTEITLHNQFSFKAVGPPVEINDYEICIFRILSRDVVEENDKYMARAVIYDKEIHHIEPYKVEEMKPLIKLKIDIADFYRRKKSVIKKGEENLE